MLVSEKLVLVPLHKDGVTAVKKLLQATVGGESRKQLGSAAEVAALGVPVVGFVCSPLIWYLSLWRQGCAGKGGLYRRLTDDARWQRVLSRQKARQHTEDSAGQPAAAARAGLPAEWSAAHATGVWYADRDDVQAFREWLRAVLGTRAMRRLVDAQPSGSAGLRAGGLMTQEYLATFVNTSEDESISTLKLDELQALDQRSAITQMFVRAEEAAADVAAVLDQLGVARSAQQDEAIRALVSDPVSQDVLDFFDADSLRLVAQHERLITTKFGYELVSASPSKGAKGNRARNGWRKGRSKAAATADESALSPDLGTTGSTATPEDKGKGQGKAKKQVGAPRRGRAAKSAGAGDVAEASDTPGAAKPRAGRGEAAKASTGGRLRLRATGKGKGKAKARSSDAADPAKGPSDED